MTARALARAHLREIHRRADVFFQRVRADAGQAMVCRAGCDGCCQDDLSLLLIESLAVCAALDALSTDGAALRRVAADRGGPPCALLIAKSGSCAVYQQRPLICRTHGLRLLADDGAGGLSLSHCELNFAGAPSEEAVLDCRPLSAALAVADAMLRESLGLADPLRIPLRALARRGRAALPLVARGSALAAIDDDS